MTKSDSARAGADKQAAHQPGQIGIGRLKPWHGAEVDCCLIDRVAAKAIRDGR